MIAGHLTSRHPPVLPAPRDRHGSRDRIAQPLDAPVKGFPQPHSGRNLSSEKGVRRIARPHRPIGPAPYYGEYGYSLRVIRIQEMRVTH